MVEALRLTRSGKPLEATSVIQNLLHDGAAEFPTADLRFVGDTGLSAQAGPSARKSDDPFALKAGLRQSLRDLGNPKVRSAAGIARGLHARAAPQVLPPGADFSIATYGNDAGSRDYKVYRPSKLSAAQVPLIVMLHGCTQSPDDFAAGTRMNLFAEKHGYLVAYPAQGHGANAQKCWNWFKTENQARGTGEASIIAGLTQQITRQYPVDPSRVYIAGLSAGGAAAASMGAAYPDLYAAFGAHSGLPCGAASDLPSALAAMSRGADGKSAVRKVPAIVFHGDSDATVHPKNGDAIVAQSIGAAAGLRLNVHRGRVPGGHAYTRKVYAEGSGRPHCEQWIVHGAAHAWAGGSESGSFTDPKGPDATQEMVRFFFQHRL